MKKLPAVLLVSLLFLGACASDQGAGDREEEGQEASVAECTDELPAEGAVKGMPEDFPKPEGAIFTDGSEAGPSFVAEGYFDGDLSESFDAWEAEFEDSGYDVTKDEQEERDAEVFFAGGGTTGQVNMFLECEGRTKLRITIRPE